MLAQFARPQAPRRFADGGTTGNGSLLATALNAATTANTAATNPILQPYPGDYNTYGFGPEWNFFAQGPGSPGTPGGATGPTGSTGGTGGTGGAGGTGATGPAMNGPQGNDAASGSRGSGGPDNATRAGDFANRNAAMTPSLAHALELGTMVMGAGSPVGMLAALAKSAFGLGGALTSPFDTPGPRLSAEQMAQISNSLQGMPENLPQVHYQTVLNDTLARIRAQGPGSGIAGNTGSGQGQAGNAPATGGVDLGGLASRMGGGDRGSVGGGGGGGGIGGNGPKGGQGGQGANAGFSRGGAATAQGLGFLANGGRLKLASGGGISGDSTYMTLASVLPIVAGLIGNISSGPIGGAIASGAATAMTGGSLADATASAGSGIDDYLKYFKSLVSGGDDAASTPQSTVDPTWAKAAALLGKLTGHVPTASSDTPGTATTSNGIYGGRGAIPYAAGGELDARGGTHVQGPGDGQSDDIPAKLSDGEFVWSAQDVSDLGDGSNKAGADRLEEMRHLVRKRAGRKNVHTIAPKQKSVAHLLGAVTGKAA